MNDTHKRNSALSMKDLEDISRMVTDVKLLAMKLMINHNLNPTAKFAGENAIVSIRLQAFSKTLQEIGKFYESH